MDVVSYTLSRFSLVLFVSVTLFISAPIEAASGFFATGASRNVVIALDTYSYYPVDAADQQVPAVQNMEGDTEIFAADESGPYMGVQQGSRDGFFKRNSLAVYVGGYRMLDMDQALDKVVGRKCALWVFGCLVYKDITEPLPIRFDSTPGWAIGIEYERQMSGLWSYGFEFTRVTHGYSAPSLTPTRGELEITRNFLTLKKFFSTGTAFQPFFGVSGGRLEARMKGAITSSYDDGGTGWSAVVGTVYKMDSVNLRAGYRYSESDIYIKDTYINDGQSRKTYGSLLTRSDGLFLGIDFRF